MRFSEGFVFIVSLRENLFVVFIKTFSQKSSQSHWYETYTLVYFSSKASLLMIKSHDGYQSIVLIGLAYVEKAYSKIQSISVHNRSYWRELRPLVTPWAWCIKEGIEPWRVQKRPFLSHVQVSLLPLSLSSPSLALFCFYCFIIIIIIIYYVYLLVKGIITVTNKPGPEYSNDQRHKPGYLNSKDTLTLTLSLSLFPNGHYMCAGYLTYTILPAGLVALHRCRLSHLYNINSLAFSSHSPLSLFPNGHYM